MGVGFEPGSLTPECTLDPNTALTDTLHIMRMVDTPLS